jgi:enoyl-CoA hydratase
MLSVHTLAPAAEESMPVTGYDDLQPDLLVTRRGNVHVVTLNAPERLNSVDDRMHHALRAVWERLDDDDQVRGGVLTGAGRAFCAGGYAPNFLRAHQDEGARARDLRNAERLARTMLQCDVPVVAAVNGPAVGLGASLAVFCDIIVMSSETYLCDPHVSVGVVAGDGGAMMWPLMISLLQAKEHLMLGDRIPAAECHRIGLVNHVVAPDNVLTKALELSERLAAQPRQAVCNTKRAINLFAQQAAGSVLTFSAATERECFASPDVVRAAEQITGGQ